MTTDKIWLRSEIMGTQVITRDSGRRLGVVGELMVDIDRREVVALGLRDNVVTRFLPGVPRYMLLDQIRQVGDVILVDNDDVIEEGFDEFAYSNIVNWEVITESGEPLGRVRGFKFDIESGELTHLVIGSLGLPLIPEGVVSTYELPVTEMISGGSQRIIVFEGAEDKLKQLSTGLLEKLGLGGGLAEEAEYGYRMPTTPVENQLPAGAPIPAPQTRYEAPPAQRQPARYEEEAEYEYVERQTQRRAEPRRMAYEEERREDYGRPAAPRREEPVDRRPADRYEPAGYADEPDEEFYAPPAPRADRSAPAAAPKAPIPYDDDLGQDVWDEPERGPELQIPERRKVREPEYEELD